MRFARACGWVAVLAPAFGAGPARGASDESAELHFARRVHPVLKARCFGCHGGGPGKPAGGLALTTRDGFTAARPGGPPAAPGNPKAGTLLRAIARLDPRKAMPPKESDRLTPAEVDAFRTWVARGAVWPAPRRLAELQARPAPAPGVEVRTSGGLSPEWTRRRYRSEDLWAYRPLAPVPPAKPGRHPVDAFLEGPIRRLGLTPAPAADRRTLIRRVTFDLTGLPPAPGDVEAFLRDRRGLRPAFTAVVERLLASPHYGEQMARHWLDVVRYADSSGFANDYERGGAWRYRDYVVRAFNSDLPYDRFITQQLAGDETEPQNPAALIATGFLRMGPWELTGMEVARVARQRFLDDVTDSVGQVFLGHTLQCARCHDHKFDPVPTRDYYRIQAALATTQLAERPVAFLPEENVAGFEERRYLEARAAHYRAVLEGLDRKEEEAARKWCADRGLPFVTRQEGLRRGLPEERLPPSHVGLSPVDLGLERIARKGLERLRWELERYEPYALAVYSGKTPLLRSVNAPLRMPRDPAAAGELEPTSILTGGDPFSPGERVSPGVLSAAGDRGLPDGLTGRRAALAAWVTAPENPLTPRVMVNRLWQWHFGWPIAGNPNNFGASGKKPVHPELLDWLAAAFQRGRPAAAGLPEVRAWSVKDLHRLILTSDAYLRDSRHPRATLLRERDPSGTSGAAFVPRRLAAEEMRDAMLAASGELNPAIGGIPVRPEIHSEVALQPRQVMGTFASAWEPSPLPAQRHRRSLYVLRLRGLRDPFMEVFNQPGPDLSCERRDATTISPQVFALLNGESPAARALALAARLMAEKRDRKETIRRAFDRLFARPPDERESAACLAHWAEMTARPGSPPPHAPRPSKVLRTAVEENTGEKFTYEEILPAAADFVPDLHPADVDAATRGLMEVCLVLINSNEFAYLD